MKSYQQFFAEMTRRQVFRVMAVYGIVGFLLLQIVDLAVPALLLPDWTYRLVALILLLGFPVAIVLAWAFEMTPTGVQRTATAAPGELTEIVMAPAWDHWLSSLLAVAGLTALLAGAWYVGRQSTPVASGDPASESVAAVGTDGPDQAHVPTAADRMASRQLYLRGDALWEAATRAGAGGQDLVGQILARAATQFDSASQLDPENADAWTGLARVYSLMGIWKILPADSVFPLVLEPAMRAIALDSTSARAHEALALKYWIFDWQWQSAYEEFMTAARLDPDNPDVPGWLAEAAHIQVDLGHRDSALATIRPAVEAGLPLAKLNYLLSLLHGHDFEAALAEARRLLADGSDKPRWLNAYREVLVKALIELHRFDEAGEALRRFEDLLSRRNALTAYYHARAGDPERAQAELAELRAADLGPPPPNEAGVQAWIGDLDRAFELLEDEFAAAGFVYFLPSDPAYAPLREDSRFDGLLARMGLECRYYDGGHECFQR